MEQVAIQCRNSEDDFAVESKAMFSVMSQALERLRLRVTDEVKVQLAMVLNEPETGKDSLNRLFPKPPSASLETIFGMYNTVASLLSSGMALAIDSAKIKPSPETLAAESQTFACVSSFDLDFLTAVAEETSNKMAEYKSTFAAAVADLVDKGSEFVQKQERFTAKVDKYRLAASCFLPLL